MEQLINEMAELKQAFENEKIKNAILMEKHKMEICKLTKVISNLNVYIHHDNSHYDNHIYITAKQCRLDLDYKDYYSKRFAFNLKPLYKLETLHLTQVIAFNFEKASNEYVTKLIIETAGNVREFVLPGNIKTNGQLYIENLHELPSLRVIQFDKVYDIDIDQFIKTLSSYSHKIEILIFIDCNFIKYRQQSFNQLHLYCEQNNIKIEF